MKWSVLSVVALAVACGAGPESSAEVDGVGAIRAAVLGASEMLPPIDEVAARKNEILGNRMDQFGIHIEAVDGGPSNGTDLLRERIDEFGVPPRTN